ncbi:MAG: glycosyltransferase family 2 protein [Kofleriaceae bacterium]
MSAEKQELAPPRVALVSTVRNPGPSIRSFVEHHLVAGFAKIYLFFDDPEDVWVDAVPESDRVDVIACDADVRASWMEWPDPSEIDVQVMVRQILNAELALQIARSQRIEWLVHLDGDELLDYPRDVSTFFAALDPKIQQVTFANLEVLPERADVADMFLELTLFKRHPRDLPGGRFSAAQANVVAECRHAPNRWFYYYTIGKSAVRVAPGVVPHGVHFFRDAAGRTEGARVQSPRVLHYMNAGFENFWRRYQTWGRFPDYWLGGERIVDRIGDFHVLARDVVAQGDRDAARRFYEERVVMNDRALASRLIDAGVCERIQEPANRLMRAR